MYCPGTLQPRRSIEVYLGMYFPTHNYYTCCRRFCNAGVAQLMKLGSSQTPSATHNRIATPKKEYISAMHKFVNNCMIYRKCGVRCNTWKFVSQTYIAVLFDAVDCTMKTNLWSLQQDRPVCHKDQCMCDPTEYSRFDLSLLCNHQSLQPYKTGIIYICIIWH